MTHVTCNIHSGIQAECRNIHYKRTVCVLRSCSCHIACPPRFYTSHHGSSYSSLSHYGVIIYTLTCNCYLNITVRWFTVQCHRIPLRLNCNYYMNISVVKMSYYWMPRDSSLLHVTVTCLPIECNMILALYVTVTCLPIECHVIILLYINCYMSNYGVLYDIILFNCYFPLACPLNVLLYQNAKGVCPLCIYYNT